MPPNFVESKGNPVLDMNRILQYNYFDLKYEAGGENSLPARGRRLAARFGTSHDTAGDRPCHPPGTGTRQEHQPVLSVADRKWGPPAHDPVIARAAREVFQGSSRISRRRSGGLPHRADLGLAHHRRPA